MSPLKEKEIIRDWCLVTYDIPYDQPKLRAHFIKMAKRAGAMQQSESCYFMPLTEATKQLAEELTGVGEVFLWHATLPRENQAKAMTEKYDSLIRKELAEIKDRLDRMADYRDHKKDALADKMKVKTDALLASVERAIIERGSLELLAQLEKLKRTRRQL